MCEPGGPVDVLKAVLRHHQLEAPVLLGYDWGAGIGLAFSVLYPARVGALVTFLPTYTETPATLLQHLVTPTMVLWVRQDPHHSWRRFKSLVRKIPRLRLEFIQPPEGGVDYSASCYEALSDMVLRPILSFLEDDRTEAGDQEAVSTQDLKANMFAHNLSVEDIEELLQGERPEVVAMRLFSHLADRMGLDEVYRAYESASHSHHEAVARVLGALPALSPHRLAGLPSLLVELGVWGRVPLAWHAMASSPRYFPGRHVLVGTQGEEVLRVATVVEVGEDTVTVEVEGERGAPEPEVVLTHKEVAILNQPHEFSFLHPSGKLRLEDGTQCDYSSPLVKAKMAEISLSLASLVDRLDFASPECAALQREAIALVRGRINMTTFLSGVDRSRVSRSECVGRLAVRGQGTCAALATTLAALLLPLAPALGIDLRYRSCELFHSEAGGREGERHRCLEVTLRPSGESLVVDPWMVERYTNPSWLTMDIHTAYGRFMSTSGELVMKTKPRKVVQTDFREA